MSVQSNKFDIRKAVLFLPGLRKFDPSGSCLIDIAGSSDPREPGAFFWKGNVSLTHVAFKPADAVRPVTGLTGVAAFKGDRMETSLITAHIGESVIQGKCRMRNFREAKVACQFNTPLLQAADVGLYGSDGDVNFHDVQGQFTVGDDRLHVDRLSLSWENPFLFFQGMCRILLIRRLLYP